LLSSPKLLLLDEPLSSLDMRLRQQILPFLKLIKDEIKIPMIYVSHDMTEIEYLTDKIMRIEAGNISN
jgi:molybdate transport system ATP-binding protein